MVFELFDYGASVASELRVLGCGAWAGGGLACNAQDVLLGLWCLVCLVSLLSRMDYGVWVMVPGLWRLESGAWKAVPGLW